MSVHYFSIKTLGPLMLVHSFKLFCHKKSLGIFNDHICHCLPAYLNVIDMLSDQKGQTCLHVAASSGHYEMVQILLGQGSDYTITDKVIITLCFKDFC